MFPPDTFRREIQNRIRPWIHTAGSLALTVEERAQIRPFSEEEKEEALKRHKIKT